MDHPFFLKICTFYEKPIKWAPGGTVDHQPWNSQVAPRSGAKTLGGGTSPTRTGLFRAKNTYAAEMKTPYAADSAL